MDFFNLCEESQQILDQEIIPTQQLGDDSFGNVEQSLIQSCDTVSTTPVKSIKRSTKNPASKAPAKKQRRINLDSSTANVEPLPVRRQLAFDPNPTEPVDLTSELEQESQLQSFDSAIADCGSTSSETIDLESDKENQQWKKWEAEGLFKRNPTLSMDSMNCKVVATFSTNYGRTVAVALDTKSNGDFTMIKIFKKFNMTGFYQRAQQVSLRTVEAERVILQFPMFVKQAEDLILNGSIPKVHIKFEKGIKADEDLDNAQWNLDINQSTNRLVRVSLITFDISQPLVSTYFQVKLYKKSEEDGYFHRDSGVTMTLQEMEEISDNRKVLIKSFKL